jgi:hypothetical protein
LHFEALPKFMGLDAYLCRLLTNLQKSENSSIAFHLEQSNGTNKLGNRGGSMAGWASYTLSTPAKPVFHLKPSIATAEP